MDVNQYITKLIDVDVQLSNMYQEQQQVIQQELSLKKTYQDEMGQLIDQLSEQKSQLVTDDIVLQQAQISQYADEYYQSHFSILSNLKSCLQIIEARQNNLSLYDNSQKLIAKNQFIDVIKLVANSFKGSNLISTQFIDKQCKTFDLINTYINNLEQSTIFSSFNPQLIYYQSLSTDFNNIIQFYTSFIEKEQIPNQLCQQIKFLSDMTQTIVHQLELLFKILIQLYENQYYHFLTQMFHNQYMFYIIEDNIVDQLLQRVVIIFDKIYSFIQRIEENSDLKPSIILTTINLLTRFVKILQLKTVQFNEYLTNVDHNFIETVYSKKITPVMKLNTTSINSSLEMYFSYLMELSKEAFKVTVLSQSDMLGTEIISQIKLTIDNFTNIEAINFDMQLYIDDYLVFCQKQIIQIIAQLSLQSAYYLSQNLKQYITTLQIPLEARITHFLTINVNLALETLNSAIFRAATTQDFSSLTDELNQAYSTQSGQFDAQPHAPWSARFSVLLIKLIIKQIYTIGKSVKIQNINTALVGINLFQRSISQLLHMSGGQYVLILRQWVSVSSSINIDEVLIIKEEYGGQWKIDGDEQLILRANLK